MYSQQSTIDTHIDRETDIDRQTHKG
jgi:hypothetical protein